MSKLEEKAVRLKILEVQLEKATVEKDMTKIMRLQSGLRFREEEEDFQFNQERRAEAREEAKRDARLNAERHRPSYCVYTEIYFDDEEEQWGCRHGGVVAYGDTPAMACDNFDHIWIFGK